MRYVPLDELLTGPPFPLLWKRDYNTCDVKISGAPNEGTQVRSIWNVLEFLNLWTWPSIGLRCPSWLLLPLYWQIPPCISGLFLSHPLACAPLEWHIAPLRSLFYLDTTKRVHWDIYFLFTSYALDGFPWNSSGCFSCFSPLSWHLLLCIVMLPI